MSTQKKRISYLLELMVVLIILSISNVSFAEQGRPGSAPTVQPKIIDPGMGGGVTGDVSPLVPLACKDRSAYNDCYRSRSQYCPNELQSAGGPAACYQRAFDDCFRVYCQ